MTVSRALHSEKSHVHGHPDGGKTAFATALNLCQEEGIALTPSRRRIFEILSREGRPLGAYEMIDRVGEATGKRPAPISIYRALDFLLENSLIHRLASLQRLSRLRPRSRPGNADRVSDLRDLRRGRRDDLGSAARQPPRSCGEAKFSPRAQVMEVAGLCSGPAPGRDAARDRPAGLQARTPFSSTVVQPTPLNGSSTAPTTGCCRNGRNAPSCRPLTRSSKVSPIDRRARSQARPSP